MTLRDLRKQARLTQCELAQLCDVSASTIGMIENGANSPSVALAKKLGEIFDVDWKIFFE